MKSRGRLSLLHFLNGLSLIGCSSKNVRRLQKGELFRKTIFFALFLRTYKGKKEGRAEGRNGDPGAGKGFHNMKYEKANNHQNFERHVQKSIGLHP
jgi:hypothetical protein